MRKKNILKKGIILGMSTMLLLGTMTGCGNSKDGSSQSGGSSKEESDTVTLTNVSYDPTRELYEQYNKIFAEHYKETTGKTIEVTQSHGGSGSQARSVVEGNEADRIAMW